MINKSITWCFSLWIINRCLSLNLLLNREKITVGTYFNSLFHLTDSHSLNLLCFYEEKGEGKLHIKSLWNGQVVYVLAQYSLLYILLLLVKFKIFNTINLKYTCSGCMTYDRNYKHHLFDYILILTHKIMRDFILN